MAIVILNKPQKHEKIDILNWLDDDLVFLRKENKENKNTVFLLSESLLAYLDFVTAACWFSTLPQ